MFDLHTAQVRFLATISVASDKAVLVKYQAAKAVEALKEFWAVNGLTKEEAMELAKTAGQWLANAIIFTMVTAIAMGMIARDLWEASKGLRSYSQSVFMAATDKAISACDRVAEWDISHVYPELAEKAEQKKDQMLTVIVRDTAKTTKS